MDDVNEKGGDSIMLKGKCCLVRAKQMNKPAIYSRLNV